MTEDTFTEEASALRSLASSMLMVDVLFGLLAPGLALILAPSVLLGGSITPVAVSTVVILIAELAVLSVHLGFQDSPAYARAARLLVAPLALAPILLLWLSVHLPPLVSFCTLPTMLVFARAAWRAWSRL